MQAGPTLRSVNNNDDAIRSLASCARCDEHPSSIVMWRAGEALRFCAPSEVHDSYVTDQRSRKKPQIRDLGVHVNIPLRCWPPRCHALAAHFSSASIYCRNNGCPCQCRALDLFTIIDVSSCLLGLTRQISRFVAPLFVHIYFLAASWGGGIFFRSGPAPSSAGRPSAKATPSQIVRSAHNPGLNTN